MANARFGVHIFTYAGTDWVTWHLTREDQDKAYQKAKKKAGMTKSRKTPYRIVKKVTR